MVTPLSINFNNYHSEGLHEECGVFGIYGNDAIKPSYACYNGLLALQHRGQESCGIAVSDCGVIDYHKDMGLVTEVFNNKILDKLDGQIALSHVRYSTAGGSVRENSQPLVMRYKKGTLAIAHNGNLTNAAEIKHTLEHRGAIFQTTIDSEAIAYVIARERQKVHSVEEAVRNTMNTIKGAYCLLVMSPRKLIAARDPNGFRPLCIGKINNSYCFASESCALDAVGADFVRDVEPGEIVIVDEDGIRSDKTHCGKKKSICIFEYIYFARSDSNIDGISVYESRKEAKVKEYLEADIKNSDLGDYVSQVLIPTEKVYQVRNGKKIVKERSYLPGYVLVEAALVGEVAHHLRNTPNVIGFLGGSEKPVPLRQSEVNRILGTVDELQESGEDLSIPYVVGETVKVNYGPFSGFSGIIEEVNTEKKKLKVMVKIFGRKTPLELGFMDVEKE